MIALWFPLNVAQFGSLNCENDPTKVAFSPDVGTKVPTKDRNKLIHNRKSVTYYWQL